MKKLILGMGTIILSVAYFAEPVAAQEVDLVGEWTFTVEPPQRGAGGGRRGGGGGRRGGGLFAGGQTLVFSAPGGALAGALRTEQGSTELTNVMLSDGNKITFTLARQTQRGSFEVTYTGTIGEDGKTITGTFEVGQGAFTINWTATRAGN